MTNFHDLKLLYRLLIYFELCQTNYPLSTCSKGPEIHIKWKTLFFKEKETDIFLMTFWHWVTIRKIYIFLCVSWKFFELYWESFSCFFDFIIMLKFLSPQRIFVMYKVQRNVWLLLNLSVKHTRTSWNINESKYSSSNYWRYKIGMDWESEGERKNVKKFGTKENTYGNDLFSI